MLHFDLPQNYQTVIKGYQHLTTEIATNSNILLQSLAVGRMLELIKYFETNTFIDKRGSLV